MNTNTCMVLMIIDDLIIVGLLIYFHIGHGKDSKQRISNLEEEMKKEFQKRDESFLTYLDLADNEKRKYIKKYQQLQKSIDKPEKKK